MKNQKSESINFTKVIPAGYTGSQETWNNQLIEVIKFTMTKIIEEAFSRKENIFFTVAANYKNFIEFKFVTYVNYSGYNLNFVIDDNLGDDEMVMSYFIRDIMKATVNEIVNAVKKVTDSMCAEKIITPTLKNILEDELSKDDMCDSYTDANEILHGEKYIKILDYSDQSFNYEASK